MAQRCRLPPTSLSLSLYLSLSLSLCLSLSFSAVSAPRPVAGSSCPGSGVSQAARAGGAGGRAGIRAGREQVVWTPSAADRSWRLRRRHGPGDVRPASGVTSLGDPARYVTGCWPCGVARPQVCRRLWLCPVGDRSRSRSRPGGVWRRRAVWAAGAGRRRGMCRRLVERCQRY